MISISETGRPISNFKGHWCEQVLYHIDDLGAPEVTRVVLLHPCGWPRELLDQHQLFLLRPRLTFRAGRNDLGITHLEVVDHFVLSAPENQICQVCQKTAEHLFRSVNPTFLFPFSGTSRRSKGRSGGCSPASWDHPRSNRGPPTSVRKNPRSFSYVFERPAVICQNQVCFIYKIWVKWWRQSGREISNALSKNHETDVAEVNVRFVKTQTCFLSAKKLKT